MSVVSENEKKERAFKLESTCMRGLANWYIYTSNVNVSQEPKKGFVEKNIQKASFKKSRRARVQVPYSKQDKRLHGAASSWYRDWGDYDTPSLHAAATFLKIDQLKYHLVM